MKSLTEKQMQKIEKNYKAFVANFGSVRIEKNTFNRGAFLVFYPAESKSFIQLCPNIDYLNGWLYGCVQGAIRGEFKHEERV